MERPSQYLVEKCASLAKALYFFTSSVDAMERRLTFLAQIDFWEWEIDEMIYAVQSFQERSRAWNAGKQGIDQMLREKGFVVKKNKLADAAIIRRYKGRWKPSVVAPIEMANKVVDRWNELLDICGSILQQDLQKYGVNAAKDFDKFKKRHLEFPEFPKVEEDD
jgi:hypothetical protein